MTLLDDSEFLAACYSFLFF